MDELRSRTLSAIKEVPGLFISDRFSARSTSNIKSHNIVRILSLVLADQVPRFDSGQGEQEVNVEIKNILIDDDPTEDILVHLQDACDWIQDGLNQKSTDNPNCQNGVLVHCSQGISRSGTFIVAYLMRKLEISFSAALALARESRPIICPNEGFQTQLQIWEQCRYNIYANEPATSTDDKSEKPVYKAWKTERDQLLKRRTEDVAKHRYSAMAAMAAHFGKRKQEASSNDKTKESGSVTESSGESYEESARTTETRN